MIEVIVNVAALYAIMGITFLVIAMIFGDYRVSVEVVQVSSKTGERKSVKPRVRDWVFGVSMSMVAFVVMWPMIIGKMVSGGWHD